MATFLDNNGDIILDAVLTDYGRQLLAKGDGSFNIVKFAFGDDEIDYGLWDTNPATATTLKDVDIMSTPIMEAFTNNAASLKSKLLTIGIENLLYLPILKLAPTVFNVSSFPSTTGADVLFNGFVVPVNRGAVTNDGDTIKVLNTGTYTTSGVLFAGKKITVDQGLDSTDLDGTVSLSSAQPELYETEYNITIDNRLGQIAADFNSDPISYISLDDDNMATYKVSQTVAAGGFVTPIATDSADSSINGYKGSRLAFTVKPTMMLKTSYSLFEKLGDIQKIDGTNNYYTIRSSIKVVGVTTGYSLEIPILFAKYKAS
jgi:hypothetical protein